MRADRLSDDEIIRFLKDLRNKDPKFESGNILSSVSTAPPDVAISAFNIFADVNALDRHIFSAAAILEREVIEFMGNLFHNPGADGYITTGGTESNIVATYAAAMMKYRNKRKLTRILTPESAHYSVAKTASLMGLEISYIPLDKNFRADCSKMKDLITDDILCVIATAGTSALGVIDPVEQIAKICEKENIYFHVDAASAGFILPFIENAQIPKFDFELDRVDSITVDPHKIGMAPIPSGAVLFRDENYLNNISISPHYLPFKTRTLSGTRSGGAIAAVWATLKHFSTEGYKNIVRNCMKNRDFFCRKLTEAGIKTVVKPELNIVGIKVDDPKSAVKQLEAKGWVVSENKNPDCIRVVIMPHTTRAKLEQFYDDLCEIAG